MNRKKKIYILKTEFIWICLNLSGLLLLTANKNITRVFCACNHEGRKEKEKKTKHADNDGDELQTQGIKNW